MKLPGIPSRDDLSAQARGLAGQAASGAAKVADTVSRAAADTSRAAARTAAQTSQRLGVDRLPGLSRLAPKAPTPVDADAGPRIAGTPFARPLATAFAARPHTRSAGSLLLGAEFLRTGLRLGGRERKQLKSHGFAPETAGTTGVSGAPGVPDLDVAELIHVHGRRLPNLMRNASHRVIKRDVRAVTDHGSATGSLHRIGVSEQEQARGAMGWTRLCVDTDQTDRLPVLSEDHHLDVVIASAGQEAGADAPVPAGADASIVRQRWREIVAAVAQNSKSTAALIDSHAMVGAIRDGVLQLQFQTAGLATTFNDRGHSPRVSQALHDVLGVDVRVRGLVGGEAGPKDPAPRGATSASAPRAARAAARAKAPAAPPARGTAAPDAKGTPVAAAERATPPDTVPRQGDPGPRREETSRSESGGDVRGGPDPRHKGTRPQRREPAAPQETQPADRPARRKAAPSKAAPAPRRENPPSSRAPIPPEAPPPDIPIPPYIPTEEDIPPEELEAAFSLPPADGFGASDAVKPGRDPAGVLAQLIDAPGVGASAHGGDDGVGESDGGKSGGGESRAAAQTGEGTAGADEADESEATAGTDPTAQTAELGDTAGEPAEAAGEATEADAGAGDARDAAALGSADGGPGRGEPGQAAKEDASPAAGGESGQAVKNDPGRDDIPFFAQRMPTPAPPPRQTPPPPTAPEAAAFPRPDRSPSPHDAVGSPDSPGPKGRGANGAQSIGDRIRATHGGGAPGGGVGSQPPAAGGGPDLRGRRPSQPGESPQRPAGKLGESAGTAPARPPSPAAAASEEDEVSDSDPAVSQSDLVGLNVVLSTFKGKVIEEIDKTSGGQ